MKLNKENWEKSKFGDVVQNINKHNKSPLTEGINRFISLEHIDSGVFNIIRWGDLNKEKTSFSKTFNPGDTLFGKRRAYLRKVAQADFKGVCSGDILVFRKKGDLLSDLIPFIASSNRFIDYAVSTSAGSLSPRTKWKDLSNYKLSLPPQDEQEIILNLFLTLKTQIEQTEAQEESLRKLKRQLLRDLFSGNFEFGDLLSKNDFEEKTFEEVADQISKRIDPAKTDLEIYVGLEHLDPDNLTIKRTGVPEDVKGIKLLIWKGDIIFGKRRAYQRKVAVSHFDGICSAHSMVLRAKENVIEKDFLPFFMQCDEFMERAVQISEGSLSPTIKWKVLKTQKFFFPKKEKQKRLIPLFKSFDKNIELLNSQTKTLKQLKQKLLDEILG